MKLKRAQSFHYTKRRWRVFHFTHWCSDDKAEREYNIWRNNVTWIMLRKCT